MALYLRIKENIFRGSKGQLALVPISLVWMPVSKYQQGYMPSSSQTTLKGIIK